MSLNATVFSSRRVFDSNSLVSFAISADFRVDSRKENRVKEGRNPSRDETGRFMSELRMLICPELGA